MPNKPKAYRGDEPFVFVSYAHADAELAYPIISGLQERGMRIWFDDGLDAGDDWEDVIPDHVEQCSAMLCLVSTRFAGSKNCKNEIRYASELNKVLMILHLETGELPRHIRFHYSAIHVLRLSDYSDHSALLDKLSVSQKLRCCVGQAKERSQEPEESPEELYRKGRNCYFGFGVPKSYEEAEKWFWKAADLGHPRAIRMIGHCYEFGVGVTQSYEAAVTWYRRAADKGDAIAMRNLSTCYENGVGVAKDQKQADYWRNKAKEAGTKTTN